MRVKSTITAKLKLALSPDQFRALRTTQLAYRDALNRVSAYAFAHGKTSNQRRLQRETYADVRAHFSLPAQMACNVPRQVGSTYQTLWTKACKNAEARRPGYTKCRFKGLDKPPKYVSPTLTYNLCQRLFPQNRARSQHPDTLLSDSCSLPGLEPPCDPVPCRSHLRRGETLV